MRSTTHRLPGLVLTDHEFTVPLDHAKPDGETITVFAREIVVPGKEKDDLPWLVFFQGGPGFGSPRPSTKSGWVKRALKEYRVLLLDQRGTGRSSPVTHQTLARLDSPQAQADYLNTSAPMPSCGMRNGSVRSLWERMCLGAAWGRATAASASRRICRRHPTG